jgi:hypothetical protein
MRLENYVAADVVRAFVEADHFPSAEGVARLHAHAVSSAFGLLGHAYGRSLLPAGAPGTDTAAHYLLVQHLGTPDMVLSLRHGSTDRALLPRYEADPATGLLTQRHDPRFPTTTFDPDEVLDPTFYTHNPPTSARMNQLIREGGGDGIVVSLAECVERYGQVRSLLGDAGLTLPADPRQLREWSLVMAMTGVLNAVDRGLVPERDVLVHGSGSYTAADYTPPTAEEMCSVDDVASLRDVVLKASAC